MHSIFLTDVAHAAFVEHSRANLSRAKLTQKDLLLLYMRRHESPLKNILLLGENDLIGLKYQTKGFQHFPLTKV